MTRRLHYIGLAAATACAIAAGSVHARPALLSQVPADAVFYSGYTEALSLSEIATAGRTSAELDRLTTRTSDPKAAVSEGGPAAGILTALYEQYVASTAEDERLLARFGAAERGGFAVYAVGALPVMRLGIDDSEAFWGQLDAAEKAAGVEGETGRMGEATVRTYAFDTDRPDNELTLVAATHADYGILTLTGSGIDEAAVNVALGNASPGESLADSGRVEAFADRHGMLPAAMGYLDHRAVIAGLGDPEQNRFGAMADRLLAAWGGADAGPVKALREPACRKDAAAIAEGWPYTVFGLTGLDSEAGRMSGRLLVRATDAELLKELRGLRGHIPTATDAEPLLHVGIGLHAAQLVPVLQKLAARFTGASFECPQLAAAQKQLAGQPIGQMGMFTAMIGDVRGVSVNLLALANAPAGPSPVSGDAIVEIATSNPQVLWQLIQSSLQLPADQAPQRGGEPVTVPQGMMPGLDLRVALRDNALVALVGEAALTDNAGEADLAPNGLLRVRQDYDLLVRGLRGGLRSVSDEGQADDAPAGYVDLTLDISEQGVGLDAAFGPAE